MIQTPGYVNQGFINLLLKKFWKLSLVLRLVRKTQDSNSKVSLSSSISVNLIGHLSTTNYQTSIPFLKDSAIYKQNTTLQNHENKIPLQIISPFPLRKISVDRQPIKYPNNISSFYLQNKRKNGTTNLHQPEDNSVFSKLGQEDIDVVLGNMKDVSKAIIQKHQVKEKTRKLSFEEPKTTLKDFFAFASEPENNTSELSILDDWRSSFRKNNDDDPLPLRFKFRRKSCCCKWCGGISNFDKEIQNSPSVAYAEYEKMQSEIQKEVARQCQLNLDILSEKEKMSVTYSNLGKVKNQKLQGDEISKGRVSSLRGIESPLAKEYVFSQASFHNLNKTAQSPKNMNDSFGFKAFQQSSPKNTKQQPPDSVKRRSHTKPKLRMVSPIKEGGSGKLRLLNKYHQPQKNKFSSFSTKNLNNFSDYVTKESPLLKSSTSFAKNLSPIKNSQVSLVTNGSKLFQVQKVVTSPTKSQQPRLSRPKLKLSTNFIEIEGESQEKNHSIDIKKICYETTVSTEFNTLGSFNELRLSKIEERQQSKGQRIVKQTLNSAIQEKHQDFMKVYLNKALARANDSSLERLTTSKISKDSMIDITTRIEKKILAQKHIYNNSVIATPTKKRPCLQTINLASPISTKKPLF